MAIIEDRPFLDIKQLLHDEGIELGEGAGAQIGVGSHSRVFKATSNRGVVAVKLIDLRRRGEYIERFLERELKIIKQLHHPNIVRVFTVPKTKEFVAITEEYAPNGDLLNFIRSRRDKRLEENEARILIRQLMEALKYLEGRFIVHRDIKCENMFLDAHFNLKLGDFGFTRELRPGEDSNTHCGSRPYAALELLSGETYKGNAVDIWSAGVVLYVCLTGYFPFGGSDEDVLKIIERQKLRSINFKPHMSQPVRDLIRDMLHPQIPARATTKTVIRHKWLANTPYKMRTAGREPHG